MASYERRRNRAPKRADIRFERFAIHACAAIALGYVYRIASFADSWIDVPLLATAHPDIGTLPALSVVVPARNEERSIERCVRSLLAQEGLDCELIVVDDRSTDATPSILERLALEDARLHVVRGEALPDGWVGKPWALAQGAARARGAWLLFTDADSVHAPRGSVSALSLATRLGADALSIATAQELGSFWERAALPAILGMILFASGPLKDINDPARPEKAIANGQYILVSRVAYDAIGGHAALYDEILEDVAFARRIKADGRFRFVLAGGYRIASVRMYRSLGEIWTGFTKNVFLGAGGDVRLLAAGALYMLLISVVPPALALRALARGRFAEALEGFAATGAIVAASSWGMRRAGFMRRLALLQPLGSALFAAIIVNSTLSVLSGRGVVWRGRRYSGRPQARPDLKFGA